MLYILFYVTGGARVSSTAEGGQIHVSRQVIDQISRCEDTGYLELEHPHVCHRLGVRILFHLSAIFSQVIIEFEFSHCSLESLSFASFFFCSVFEFMCTFTGLPLLVDAIEGSEGRNGNFSIDALFTASTDRSNCKNFSPL